MLTKKVKEEEEEREEEENEQSELGGRDFLKKNSINTKTTFVETTSPTVRASPVKNDQPSTMFNFNGEKLLIRKDGSVMKKASEEIPNERDISCQEDFQAFLLNQKLKEKLKHPNKTIAPKMRPILENVF